MTTALHRQHRPGAATTRTRMSYDAQLLGALVGFQTSDEYDVNTPAIPRDRLGPAGRAAGFRDAVLRLAEAGLVELSHGRPDPTILRVTSLGLREARTA